MASTSMAEHGLDRMNVLLDLDNTIINALESKEQELIETRPELSKFDCKKFTAYGMSIYARPGLQEFLDFLFQNFNVSVYTAAEQEYATFIIEKFILTKPERDQHFKHIFWRYHVEMGEKHYGEVKDLRLLFNVIKVPNFYPCNTVIIDDLDDVYLANPHNTIRVKAFDMIVKDKNDNITFNKDAVNDKELKRIVNETLSDLKDRYKSSKCFQRIYNNETPPFGSPFDLY